MKVKTFYDPVAFSLRAAPFATAEYSALPQWVQTVIAQSPEYRLVRGGGTISGGEQLELIKAQRQEQARITAPTSDPKPQPAAPPRTAVAGERDDELNDSLPF